MLVLELMQAHENKNFQKALTEKLKKLSSYRGLFFFPQISISKSRHVCSIKSTNNTVLDGVKMQYNHEKKRKFLFIFYRLQISQKVMFNISNGLLPYYPIQFECNDCFLKIRNEKKILYCQGSISLKKLNLLSSQTT